MTTANGLITTIVDANQTTYEHTPTLASSRNLAQKTAPIILAQSGIPIGMPPGNGSTTGLKFTNTAGAFSLTTSTFPMIYAGGIWLWVPVNGFTASTPAAAGLYWATTSTTSVGILYNVKYSDTGGVAPTSAQLAAAPAVTTNNYWMTQQVTAATVLSVTIPSGSMGPGGSVVSELFTSHISSGTAKTTSLIFGGTAVLTQAPTTTLSGRYRNRVMNRGEGKQIYATSTVATAYVDSLDISTANLTMAIDTTADVALTLTQQLGANTDYLILESYNIELRPTY